MSDICKHCGPKGAAAALDHARAARNTAEGLLRSSHLSEQVTKAAARAAEVKDPLLLPPGDMRPVMLLRQVRQQVADALKGQRVSKQ